MSCLFGPLLYPCFLPRGRKNIGAGRQCLPAGLAAHALNCFCLTQSQGGGEYFPAHCFPASFPIPAPLHVTSAAHLSLGFPFPTRQARSAAPSQPAPAKPLRQRAQLPMGFAVGPVAQWAAAHVLSPVTPEGAASAFCPAQERTITASLALGEKRVSMAARNSTSMTVRLCKKLDIFFLEKMLLFLTKGLFEV